MKKRLFLFLIPLLLAGASALPPEKRAGKDFVVFFYVTQFQPGWQSLPDTKSEAEALKTALETQYGFEGKLVPNPTKQQIYDEIAAWNNRLGPDDQVLFFFSMHGYYDPGSELGYLIAADGLYKDEYFKTWLDYNSLRPYFARCKAKHVLVALDACYSGSFGNIEKAPDHPAYDESQDCQTQIDAAFNYRVRQYICAGNKNSKTPGKSLFAAKLLETLRQGSTADADGILHFDDITYALGKVRSPEPVHGAFAGHTPGGEFVFVRKNACESAPAIDPIEENLWKKALQYQDGEVYLAVYPEGKYAKEAIKLTDTNKNAPPNIIALPEKLQAPDDKAPYSLTYQFRYDFEFDRYVPIIRPLRMRSTSKKMDDRLRNGDYEYFEKQLKKASRSDEDEITSYLAYTYFVTKRFSNAKPYFSKLAEKQGDYYAASNYYLGFIDYFENNLDESLRRFQRVLNNKNYGKSVYSYTVNILYLKNDTAGVITYGDSILNSKDSITVGKRAEIMKTIAYAYFDQKKYAEADQYFRFCLKQEYSYINSIDLLLRSAKAQIEIKKFEDAIATLQRITQSDGTKVLQQSLYYQANANIAIGKKNDARTNLDAVRKMQVDQKIEDECALNFGKLSYELKDNKVAAEVLSPLVGHDVYGPEARYWLNLALDNK